MPIEGLEAIMLTTLGYEDVGQFEDALGGSFYQFIQALPHMESKIQDDGSSCDGECPSSSSPPLLLRCLLNKTLLFSYHIFS
jgi:hypothetical protein